MSGYFYIDVAIEVLKAIEKCLVNPSKEDFKHLKKSLELLGDNDGPLHSGFTSYDYWEYIELIIPDRSSFFVLKFKRHSQKDSRIVYIYFRRNLISLNIIEQFTNKYKLLNIIR